MINPLNAELNPIWHLLALLEAHHIFHVSGLRVKSVVMWLHILVVSLLMCVMSHCSGAVCSEQCDIHTSTRVSPANFDTD